MPWFKVDDSFYDHPKVFDASDAAIALWTRAGSWAARNLTDGFVPSAMLARLCGDGKRAAAELCDRGLWQRAKGGYLFHDWSDFQPTKEAVDNDRKLKAERQKRWREARRRRVTNGVSNASGDAAPTRPAPKEAGRGRAPSPAQANGRASPPGSPARLLDKPPWCGECDELTRQTGNPDEPARCPKCHPLAFLENP